MKRIVMISALAAAAAAGAPQGARANDVAVGAAVGMLGGMAIGGALAGSAYYPGKQIYAAPVYVAPPRRRVIIEEEVEPTCFVKRRRYVDEFGDVVIRKSRVCD